MSMYAQICFFLFLMFISFKNNGDNTSIKKVDESNLKAASKGGCQSNSTAFSISNLLNENQCVTVSKASCATVDACSVSETCNTSISLEIPGKNPMSCSSKLAQKSCSGKKDEIKCAGKIVQNSDAVQVVATK